MQPQDANHKYNFHDPTWQLLKEVSIPFFDVISEETSFLLLMETIRALGLRQLHFERLRADIIRALNYAIKRSGQVEPALPIIVRLFVKKKEAEGIFQGKRPPGEETGLGQRVTSSSPEGWTRKGNGWSYFLSERFLDQTDAGRKDQVNLIELFLYREGM